MTTANAPEPELQVSLARRAETALEYLIAGGQVAIRSRLLGIERPDRVARSVRELIRLGFTPAGAYAASAIRRGDSEALIDELGTLTFGEIHRRTNALADALAVRGVEQGSGVAIMCRNHRGFIEASVACSKLGAVVLYLNTSFAGPQIADVLEREDPATVIYDQEFDNLVADGARKRARIFGWADEPGDTATLDGLIDEGSQADRDPPAEPGKFVILTSGTTGKPKGARRKEPDNLLPIIAMLSKIPLRANERTLIAAPLFHSWGFAHFTLGLALGSTYVLQRKFDPEGTLEAIERYRVTAVPMVPVMLQRIMELPAETRRKYDCSSLRLVPVSGSQLTGELAGRFMDEFGDVICNLYGSTEVAWATIATPKDLREAPGTAGRTPVGTILKILDEDGHELPRGETGRIFVANAMLFEGYTGGGSKEQVGNLMATGDVGYLDDNDRLFVVGRDDEMIVSGGENVFPHEVEELLVAHPDVADAAVIGVDDEQFGQRLKAFVVKVPGAGVGVEELQQHVRSNLARFKVPREIEFLDDLPRNVTGKVLKKDLRRP